MKPYYGCKCCKTYAQIAWPEFKSWAAQHKVELMGFDVPEGYTCIISPIEELARECRDLEDEPNLPALQLHACAFEPKQSHREVAEDTPLRPCPKWLGNFSFRQWGGKHPDPFPFPAGLAELVPTLEALVPAQKFNTVFLQRYERGQAVYEHRDPKNNLGHTVIGLFGEWTGGTSIISFGDDDVNTFDLQPGNALVMACTIDGKQGPLHSVSPVLSGTRWALILNTIV